VIAAPAVNDAARSYTLTKTERLASIAAEQYALRTRNPNPPQPSIIQTRAQQARNPPVPPVIDNHRPAANIRPVTPEPARAPSPPVIQAPARTYPRPTVEEEVPEAEAEHPFRNAKDAAYAPPAAKNVGALSKAPAYKKPEVAYRTLPPIHDPEIAGAVFDRMMDQQIPLSAREVLSLSPEIRARTRDVNTTRRVANQVNAANAVPTSFIVDVDEAGQSAVAYSYEEVEPPTL
jgi:hypothetical protein